MVHHLQQDVEHIGVRLLYLVEQQHRVGLLGDCLGQQATLVEADIAGRRTDQARHRVPFHVLGHVEPDQFDAHRVGQLACHLGLADPGRAAEQEAADRLLGVAQAGARHLDGGCQRIDRLVLPEHRRAQVTVEVLQRGAVIRGHVARRDARDLGDDVLDLVLSDHLALAGLGQYPLGRAGLVDHVDRLIRQMTVVDEAGRQFRRGTQRRGGVLDTVVRLEAALEAAQDLDRFRDAGLGDIDLLEAARQRMVFLEHAAVLGIGGRADALELPLRERRLEQVGCVERAARCRPCTDQGVDLVDEQHGIRVLEQLLEHRLQTLLEIATVLRAGEQCAHVERIDLGLAQDVGYVAFHDAPREPLGDRGLAHAGLAHQQRVVLAAAAERLDHALDLAVAADQRIDLARERQLVQVHRVGLERPAPLLFLLGLGLGVGLGRLRRLRHLADAVRDEVHHVEPVHAALVQEIDGVRVLLAEDGDQHVRAGDFLLAGGLHMQDRALDHPLEAQRRLGIDVLAVDHRRVLGHEFDERLAQVFDVDDAGLEDFRGRRIVEQRQQQVLYRDEFMAFLPRLHEGHVEADFQFLSDHLGFFHHALQRVLMLARERQHLFHFRLGEVPGIDAADTHAVTMHLQHHLGRLFTGHREDRLQNGDDEIHGGVIVIEQQHLEHRGRLYATFLRFEDGSVRTLDCHRLRCHCRHRHPCCLRCFCCRCDHRGRSGFRFLLQHSCALLHAIVGIMVKTARACRPVPCK